MPHQHKPDKIQQPSFFAKGNFLSKDPGRTPEELERLRIAAPRIPAIPPRWKRIDPAQYLKERGNDVVVIDSNGRKDRPPIRFVMTAGTPSPCLGV